MEGASNIVAPDLLAADSHWNSESASDLQSELPYHHSEKLLQ